MRSVAGWYGKIPSLGDFASRRLPTEFITPWDSWLQDSIAASHRILADRWLDLYLTSPMWRFALTPGVCGENAWAGLLMPSVDKVGRHFPLTLAVPLDPKLCGTVLTSAGSAQAWYSDVEKVALSALGVNFLPEDLENALAQIPFPETDAYDALSPSDGAGERLAQWWRLPSNVALSFRLATADALHETLTAAAEHAFAAQAAGKTLWWSEAADSGLTEVHCFNNLPAHDYFVVLLGENAQA